MPNRAKHGCAWPGCPELVDRGACCSKHTTLLDQKRGSASSRGYDANWRRLRKLYLSAHPLCGDPYNRHTDVTTAATDVDHIVPIRKGGRKDDSNLQSLCHECHTYKTLVMGQ